MLGLFVTKVNQLYKKRCPLQFLELARFCQTMIACRTRKDQKGILVSLMTENVSLIFYLDGWCHHFSNWRWFK